MAIHAAMVDRMDREIGRVVAQLKAMGEYENTLPLPGPNRDATARIVARTPGLEISTLVQTNERDIVPP